jgi:hypothetical protein
MAVCYVEAAGMNHPTPEQLAAMRRIQIGIQKVFEAQQKINQIINEFDLEAQHGIIRLPAQPLSITVGALGEVFRLHHLAESQQRRAA